MSGSLLRCVYRTCSYRDDYESSIYRAALVPNQKSFNVPQTGTFVDWQRDVVPWFVMWTMITDIKTKKISNSVLLNLVYTCKMKFRSSSLQRVIIHISHFDVKLAVITDCHMFLIHMHGCYQARQLYMDCAARLAAWPHMWCSCYCNLCCSGLTEHLQNLINVCVCISKTLFISIQT